ncbi:MAG: rhamnogalacturonan acetylesterase, partial [Gemmatimonadaceae bacterium]
MMRLATLALLAALAVGGGPDRATLFMIGDSTMADRPTPEKNPYRGWGQMLQSFFDDSVVVRNFAVNGRSTKSFIDEGRWVAVVA